MAPGSPPTYFFFGRNAHGFDQFLHLMLIDGSDERFRIESWEGHQFGALFETEQHDAEQSVNMEERKYTN